MAKAIGNLGGEVMSFGTLGAAFEKRTPELNDYLNATGVLLGIRGVRLVGGGLTRSLTRGAKELKQTVETEGITLKEAVNNKLKTALEIA